MRWFLTSVGGEGVSLGAASVGTFVHDIVAELPDAPLVELKREVDERWGRLGLKPGWVTDRTHQEAHDMVARFAAYRDGAEREWERVGIETGFRVEVGRAVVAGRVDRIERDAEGRLRIVDLKTGKSKPTKAELAEHGQLGAYQVAVEEGGFPDLGERSAGAALVFIGKGGLSGLKPSVLPQPPLAGSTDPTWARTLVEETAEGMGAGGVPCLPGQGVRDLPGAILVPGPARGRRAVTTIEASNATGRATAVQHSALDIATALEMPPPTAEQAAVIEAGARPLLVVAGAGSGKTETMAARVVWLVANGLVDPDQVLGLTFTRKAAAELSQRIAKRLRGLERAGIWTPPADDGTGAEVLGGTPTVSTYHAYAGRLVREHALRVGIEPEFRILTEAGAWQLAAEAVSRWDGADGRRRQERGHRHPGRHGARR